MILILEDNADRLAAFRHAVSKLAGEGDPRIAIAVSDFIDAVTTHGDQIRLISLDHDLYAPAGSRVDPGDGLDAARWLTTRVAWCPVIIHSSNADRSRMMQGELELAHWDVHPVPAIGEKWIQTDWLPVAESLLQSK